jgi:hypothetical protein
MKRKTKFGLVQKEAKSPSRESESEQGKSGSADFGVTLPGDDG